MNNERHFGWNNKGRGRGSRGFWRGKFNERGSWRGSMNFRNHPGNFGDSNKNSDRQFKNHQWKGRPRRDKPDNRLSEKDIGVTEYISDLQGFNGVIKSRYSDFQVSEINLQGEVAKLTDITAPSPPVDKVIDEDEELLLSKYNLEILPLETWDNLNKISTCTEQTDETVEIDVTEVSKEQRTKIHNAVKKAFGQSIVGSTINAEDKKTIKFQKFRKGVRIDNRVKWIWPSEYVYFILHKENCDTMEAASKIAETMQLNIKSSMITYAGTKDRRAKTSQWMCVRKMDPKRIALACERIKDVHVGNFTFHETPLKLGLLKGNKFRIALRNVTASEDQVNAACQYLKDNGFINYYGLQRFGTKKAVPTHEIGIKLLQGRYREAIDLILHEREGPLQHMLQVYAQGGPIAALSAVHRKSKATEARIVRALCETPNDLIGVLSKVPRNTRLLYLHSYQSLIWNRAVTERIKRFGLQPAVGDIVLEEEGFEEEVCDETCEDDNCNPTDDLAAETDSESDSNAESDKNNDVENNVESNDNASKNKMPVKVLTQEDIDGGTYTIFDVALPLPGHMVVYPPNMKDYYEELMSKDSLTLELKNKVKCYTMSGAYRLMVDRPREMSWEMVSYSEPYCDLILSDLDELNKKETTGIIPDGKYKALLLTLTLPSSCYATMVLRELLKINTSGDHQASLNDYHKQDKSAAEKETETASEQENSLSNNSENILEEVEKEVEDEVEKGNKRKIDDDDKDSDVKKVRTD